MAADHRRLTNPASPAEEHDDNVAATPQIGTRSAEVARHGERGGVATVIRPYLDAFTAVA